MIQFNIAFALSLKALFLVLALLGYSSLWLAILADTGATLTGHRQRAPSASHALMRPVFVEVVAKILLLRPTIAALSPR